MLCNLLECHSETELASVEGNQYNKHSRRRELASRIPSHGRICTTLKTLQRVKSTGGYSDAPYANASLCAQFVATC